MGRAFIRDFVDLKLAPDQASAEAAFKAAHPLGFGRPEDVACALLFLACDAARWGTGTELVLDGGHTAALGATMGGFFEQVPASDAKLPWLGDEESSAPL